MKKTNLLSKLGIAATVTFGTLTPMVMMMPVHAQENTGVIDTYNVENLDITLVNEAKWTGSPVEQIIQIKNGDYTLVEGTDYTVDGNVATDYGSYTLTVTGINDYHGEKQVLWVLSKENTDIVNIGNCNIQLANQLTNSGTQKVNITNGDKVLEEGTDYTLSGNEASAPGTYTMTITGKGQFTGSIDQSYTVDGTTEPKEEPKSNNTGLLVAIGVGCAAAVGAGIALMRKKNKPEEEQVQASNEEDLDKEQLQQKIQLLQQQLQLKEQEEQIQELKEQLQQEKKNDKD